LQAAGVYLQAAAIELALGQPDLARVSYQSVSSCLRPEQSVEEKQTVHLLVAALFGEASLDLAQADYQQALACYQKAQTLLAGQKDRELGFQILYFEAARMQSYCYEELGQPQSSMECILDALTEVEQVPENERKNFLLEPLAETFCRQQGSKDYQTHRLRFEALLDGFVQIENGEK